MPVDTKDICRRGGARSADNCYSLILETGAVIVQGLSQAHFTIAVANIMNLLDTHGTQFYETVQGVLKGKTKDRAKHDQKHMARDWNN